MRCPVQINSTTANTAYSCCNCMPPASLPACEGGRANAQTLYGVPLVHVEEESHCLTYATNAGSVDSRRKERGAVHWQFFRSLRSDNPPCRVSTCENSTQTEKKRLTAFESTGQSASQRGKKNFLSTTSSFRAVGLLAQHGEKHCPATFDCSRSLE